VILDARDVEAVFTADPANIHWFVARIVRAAPGPSPSRILDIGCGDGLLLLALAEAMPQASLVGVDISPTSVAAARERIEASLHGSRISALCGDFMAFDRGQFGLITAFQALEAMDAPTEQVAATLARDVAPGGVLIYVMPYRCLYNSVLNTLRNMLRRVRGSASDWIILRAANLVHRGQSQEWLRQRVHYMYAVTRHYDESLREALRHQGFHILHMEAAPHTSPGQLRHRLAVLAARPAK
jgi:SAM-dependent methyltransferase